MVQLNRKYCISYLSQLLIPRIHAVVSKLLDLSKVLLREIIFYKVCASDSVIDRQKSCRHGWDNLFRKSSVEKEYCYENAIGIEIN